MALNKLGVKTGDTSAIGMYGMEIIGAFTGIGAALRSKRKAKKENESDGQ